MKKLKYISFLLIAISTLTVTTAIQTSSFVKSEKDDRQVINLLISNNEKHYPFSGKIESLSVDLGEKRKDGGNPMENFKMSFELDPNNFIACADDELTLKARKLGEIEGESNNTFKFTSTKISTIGIDWYQLEGLFSIQGVEKKVVFSITGLRNPSESESKKLVVEGKVNLSDWGVDFEDNDMEEYFSLNMIIEMEERFYQ